MVQKSNTTQKSSLIRPSVSFADVVKQIPLTGANAVPVDPNQAKRSVLDRLFFLVPPEISKTKGKEPIGQAEHARSIPEPIGQLLQTETGPSASGPDSRSASILGQRPTAKNPSSVLPFGICSRCLTYGHPRAWCKSAIRCFACGRGGHIAANCLSNSKWKAKAPRVIGKKSAVNSENATGPSVLGTDVVAGPN